MKTNNNIITRDIKTDNRIKTRNEIITGAKRGGRCTVCGNKTDYLRTIVSNNTVYFCEEHAHCGCYSYHSEKATNYGIKGKPIKSGVTVGVELESNGYSFEVYKELTSVFKMLPTQDSTVCIEYVSPIYNSLSSLSKMMGLVESANNDANINFSVTDENCGLHTHFGSDKYNAEISYKYYNELFSPLAYYIENSLTANDRIKIFGRDFSRWAKRIDWYEPDEHKNWINIQHDHTIEVRLFHFSNAENYLQSVKIFREVFTEYLTTDAETINKQKAVQMGAKMLKTFKKYY